MADPLASKDLAEAVALPGDFYTGAAMFERDRDLILKRSWQLLGLNSQVAGSGDHLVSEIAGVPVLLMRDESGVLRAFENICRHRAGPLATCNGQGAKAIRCRYHGWTYSLSGQLRSASEMQDARDFEVNAIRLRELPLALWRGLVFVALEPELDLPTLLDGMAKRLGAREFGHYRFARRVSYRVACNWKVYVENYLEGYHVPHVHPGLNKLLDYRSYVTEVDAWHSLQWSPMASADAGNFYGEGEALYYYLWPNTMLNILPDRLQTNRVLALDGESCQVDFDYYYPYSESAEELERRVVDQNFSDQVQQEDAEICAQLQRALASGRYQPGRLNPKRENALHHFQELLRAAYRDGQSG